MIVNNLKVSWVHENNGPKRVGFTHCIIQLVESEETTATKDDPVFVSRGVARCSKYDPYNKALGRKLSFALAVEQIRNKNTRTLLWDKFKEVSPKSVSVRTHG
jgi:hypothetical protein